MLLARASSFLPPKTRPSRLCEISWSVRFGDSGETVVIEELMIGEEARVSHFVTVNVRLMPASQDHKRIRDGDEGPNTEAWVYCPAPVITPAFSDHLRVHLAASSGWNGCRRFSFLRCPLRRHHGDEGWSKGGGIQLPLWRSRDAGNSAAARVRSLEIRLACDVPGGLRGRK